MAVIDKFVKSPERKSANNVVATMKAFGGDSVDGPVNTEYGKVAPGRESTRSSLMRRHYAPFTRLRRSARTSGLRRLAPR
jgi:hypothetical protein